jgi:two-component sensor histidine kinase
MNASSESPAKQFRAESSQSGDDRMHALLEAELAHRLQQQELLAHYGLFVADRLEIDPLLQEACRVAAKGLDTEHSKILEWVRDGDYLLIRCALGWASELTNWATMSAHPDTPAGYALATKQPVLSDINSSNDRLTPPPLAASHGIKKSITVLIPTFSGYFGVLEIDCVCDCDFTGHDVNFVSSVANLLGAALTRREADAELSLKQAALEAANVKRTILAKEIHHRVKNGLQLVASLLAMQARAAEQPQVRAALADAEMRVIAVARVYDHLSVSVDAVSVELGAFLSELCASLVASAPEHHLKFICAEQIEAPSERAIYLGLIVNELVTNAIKHAYPQGGGEIIVRVQSDRGGRLSVEVIDHGVGVPLVGTTAKRTGLGGQLSEMLAKFLGGTLRSASAKPGLCWTLKLGPATSRAKE